MLQAWACAIYHRLAPVKNQITLCNNSCALPVWTGWVHSQILWLILYGILCFQVLFYKKPPCARDSCMYFPHIVDYMSCWGTEKFRCSSWSLSHYAQINTNKLAESHTALWLWLINRRYLHKLDRYFHGSMEIKVCMTATSSHMWKRNWGKNSLIYV